MPPAPPAGPSPEVPPPALDHLEPHESQWWKYRIAFQVWIIFFLLALAVALLNYLVSFFKAA